MHAPSPVSSRRLVFAVMLQGRKPQRTFQSVARGPYARTRANSESTVAQRLAELLRQNPGKLAAEPPESERKSREDAKEGLRDRGDPAWVKDERWQPNVIPPETTGGFTALVEGVQLFLRSGRPTLAMSLRDPFTAEVVLERVRPGEVSIRLLAQGRRLTAREVEKIRKGLQRSGIRLTGFHAAGADISPADSDQTARACLPGS